MRWFSTILVVAAFTLNAKVVFKTADGSLEKLKAIAECHAVYDDAILHFLERLALNSGDEIANAGKCVKCLNDAGPAFKNAVLASGRALATVMDEISAVIKGGTHTAEKIDPAKLVSLLQKLANRQNPLDYKVTHFTNHIATLLSKNPSIQGLLSKAPGSSSPCLVDNILKQMDVSEFGPLGGHLFHLQEAAKLVTLKTLPAHLAEGFKLDTENARNAALNPKAIILNTAETAKLDQLFLNENQHQGMIIIEYIAPFL